MIHRTKPVRISLPNKSNTLRNEPSARPTKLAAEMKRPPNENDNKAKGAISQLNQLARPGVLAGHSQDHNEEAQVGRWSEFTPFLPENTAEIHPPTARLGKLKRHEPFEESDGKQPTADPPAVGKHPPLSIPLHNCRVKIASGEQEKKVVNVI